MSDSMNSTDSYLIERIFEAPIALIWQLWTEPEHFKNWYGPKGFTIPVAKMDVRVGGKRLICMEMQMPNRNMKIWFTGEYREVSPTERLVYTDSLADANGNALSPSALGMPEGSPETTEVTVLLEDLGGRTKMVMTHAGVPANSNGLSGWEQSFAKMVEYVETVRSSDL